VITEEVDQATPVLRRADQPVGVRDAGIALDGVQRQPQAPTGLAQSHSGLQRLVHGGMPLQDALIARPWHGLGRRGTPARGVRGRRLLHHRGEVVPQVPAATDLDRLGERVGDGLGIRGRAVPADDLHPGVIAQPGRQGLGGAIGQHRDGDTLLARIDAVPGEPVMDTWIPGLRKVAVAAAAAHVPVTWG
jgi:hypothetical protein